MTHFETVLADIFDRGAERRLSQVEERETIHAAKAGDEAAVFALIYAYSPTLRNAAERYNFSGASRRGDTLHHVRDVDEARSCAVLGLIEAVHAVDLDVHDRLAGVVAEYIAASLGQYLADTTAATTVPGRTLRRFFHIRSKAGGDDSAALRLCPEYLMKRETYLAVLDAVRAAHLDQFDTDDDEARAVIERAQPIWGADDAYADAEDRILVELAFSVVDDLETDICRMSYGFTDYLPVPDGQIAHVLGMARPTVQRRRVGALTKMRAALGA